MITVKYPSGRSEKREFVIASGENPIGSARPVQDDSVLEIMDGCVKVTVGEDDEGVIWPWAKITELRLGPKVSETVLLREV